ncbi:MAG TPA: tetratricopeptide repeat protein [Gemmatimonadaceae bacterium]|nr:tetratricopeptide repeat protein [Gemmatimonadaceae bacterium]
MTLSDRVRHAAPAAGVALLALAASVWSLTNGFVYDDVHAIVRDERIHSLAAWWEVFTRPYWSAAIGAGLYRPLTSLAYALLWALGKGSALPYHAANIVLYTLVCVAVWRLARHLLPAGAAWLAAALFAVHPVHVEAVAGAVGLAELLASLAVVAAVAVYVSARRRGDVTLAGGALVAALYVMATLAKEHGVLLPALLAAAELTVVDDRRPWRTRARALATLFVVLTMIGGAYVVARDLVPGVTLADASVAPLARYERTARVYTFLSIVPEWARLFLWPARLSADYSPPAVAVVEHPSLALLPGAAILMIFLALIVAARRRAPVVTFGLVWAAITLALVTNLVVLAGFLLAERTLFLASVGVVLAVGAGVALLRPRLAALPSAPRRAAAAAVALLLAAGVTRSALRQRVWRDDETLLARTVADAPLSYRAHWMWSIRLFETGRLAAGEREARIALRLHERDPALHTDLAARYKLAGRCDAAVPLFRSALALDPWRNDARLLLLECLFALGEFSAARAEADSGARYWPKDPGVARAAVLADSLLALRIGR